MPNLDDQIILSGRDKAKGFKPKVARTMKDYRRCLHSTAPLGPVTGTLGPK